MNYRKISLSYFLFAFVLVLGFAVWQVKTSSAHEIDSLVQSGNGTVYYITYGTDGNRYKVPFTSEGALKSYGFLSLDQVVPMDWEDLNTLDTTPMPPKNGTVFCATETKDSDIQGECSLITDGRKAAFPSEQTLNDAGFSLAKAFYGDSSFLEKTDDITDPTAAHLSGVLIGHKDKTYLVNGVKSFIPVTSEDVLYSWGWAPTDVVPANTEDLELIEFGVMPERQARQFQILSLSDNELSEIVLLFNVASKHQDPPSEKYSNQSEAKTVLKIHNENIDKRLSEVEDILESKSRSLLEKLPLAFAEFDKEEGNLVRSTYKNAKATILDDGTIASAAFDNVQSETAYVARQTVYYVKENKEWKIDLISSIKQLINEQEAKVDPISGKGTTDLRLVSAKLIDLSIGDQAGKLEVRIKNQGRTTVNRYSINAALNGYNLIDYLDSTSSYVLEPGQEIILQISLIELVDLNIAPGRHEIEVSVSDLIAADKQPSNNNITLKQNVK